MGCKNNDLCQIVDISTDLYFPLTLIMNSCVKQPLYYPYNLLLYENAFDTRTFLCISSYIALQWAVTAATCFLNVTKPCILVGGSEASLFAVIYGDPLQQRFVRNWVRHPNYNSQNEFTNNIALIRLLRPFNLGDFVNVVKMFAYDELHGCDVVYLCETCTLLYTNFTSSAKTVLQITEVHNMKRKWCNPHGSLDSSALCTERKRLSNEQCWNMTGSPLICKKKLLGFVISVNVSDAKCEYIFTRVDMFQNWFQLHIPLGLYYDKDALIICDQNKVTETVGSAIYNALSTHCIFFALFICFVL